MADEFVVHVRGMRETVRAFRAVDAGLAKEVKQALAKAAEPVAQGARDRLSRYRGISLGTISPRATQSSVFVTQRAKKRTGKRGDFGALQMTHGLMPALEDHFGDTVREVENALDAIIDRNF